MKEIYSKVTEASQATTTISLRLGGESISIKGDIIGEILVNADCLSYVRYIEEILEVKLDRLTF